MSDNKLIGGTDWRIQIFDVFWKLLLFEKYFFCQSLRRNIFPLVRTQAMAHHSLFDLSFKIEFLAYIFENPNFRLLWAMSCLTFWLKFIRSSIFWQRYLIKYLPHIIKFFLGLFWLFFGPLLDFRLGKGLGVLHLLLPLGKEQFAKVALVRRGIDDVFEGDRLEGLVVVTVPSLPRRIRRGARSWRARVTVVSAY